MSTPDTIEREIRIDAPVERVWALVSEPGWWINEGTVRPHRIEQRDGVSVVTDEKWGEFPIETTEVVDQRTISFRWLVNGDADTNRQDAPESSLLPTVVTFTLEPADGGTLVRVVERGFSGGDVADEVRQKAYEDNTEGWETELGAAKKHVEGS
ncbi:SRPBCC domain-containing protein [Luteipulveratus sp. YIM 133132]|uniref:SRPBCC domain-containing protein n=1 Tax=Luteipulveratus flavus TaxID=3031728 RepID=UPI0023B13EB1|nr:SRPBCC domain-containing protein [Luteipulveratus sp. YIM 133132]MDE9366693.1 SRPBCC domain-containing protein [Luteipulveratus sp. YIM 133132]